MQLIQASAALAFVCAAVSCSSTQVGGATTGTIAGTMITSVNGSPAIKSAGGYLRALTDKARAGEFALGPMLMALMGQRLKAKRLLA